MQLGAINIRQLKYNRSGHKDFLLAYAKLYLTHEGTWHA